MVEHRSPKPGVGGSSPSVPVVFMREISKFEAFFKDIWIELSQKMTWPSRKQLIDMTAVVIIFIVLWAAYLGVLDLAFAKGFEKFLQFAKVV